MKKKGEGGLLKFRRDLRDILVKYSVFTSFGFFQQTNCNEMLLDNWGNANMDWIVNDIKELLPILIDRLINRF